MSVGEMAKKHRLMEKNFLRTKGSLSPFPSVYSAPTNSLCAAATNRPTKKNRLLPFLDNVFIDDIEEVWEEGGSWKDELSCARFH